MTAPSGRFLMRCTMTIATPALLAEIERRAEARREEIRRRPDALCIEGSVYYVSADGSDDADGLTEASAWRTPARVSAAPLLAGDGVLFRRGDIFRGTVIAKSGVTYGAYGEGDKPCLVSGERDLADPSLWESYDAAHAIWRLRLPLLDVGNLIFDGGRAHGYRHIPSYIGGRFVVREDESRPFAISEELKNDLDFYWHYEDRMTEKAYNGQSFPVPQIDNESFGTLYLCSKRGNPGEVFSSIEAAVRRQGFAVGECENVRIDNICLKYIGWHAVAAAGMCIRGLRVTGCEIGWIGGCIHSYFGTDPNYPEGGRGTIGRFGNGVEIYGGCLDYEVSDCYVYECYDAGVTHQVTTFGRTFDMKGIVYKNNLIEKCVYSIEYFLEVNGGGGGCMEDVLIEGNLLRFAGEGWGQQRHNKHTPAHLKGWSFTNTAKDYRVIGNCLDRAAYRMVHLVADEAASCPRLSGNTFIQYLGHPLGQYGGKEQGEPPVHAFLENAEAVIRTVLGDTEATVITVL